MNEQVSDIWQAALEEIKKHLSKPSFETWLKTTKPVTIHNNTFIVEVPNDFTKDWLENRYRNLIFEALYKVTNTEFSVNFVTSTNPSPQDSINSFSSTPSKNKNLSPSPSHTKNLSWLNPKYTFETFIVGSCNRLAHAASLAVAEAPSKAYNPLFIYGGVGLGKTHLMHAISHYVVNNNLKNKIKYLSSEKFTNEFINSIRDNRTVEFRNKYRNIDILLIDDIQFLAGKEQTQEEFFHTFNALHENNKQIIVSSDRPPKEIPTLEDRLRTRFEWGLITDIQPPDLETRIAILHKKASLEGLHIPSNVVLYIATRIEKNIRELEGALIRVIAYSSLANRQIDLALAKEALQDIIIKENHHEITIEQIQSATADYFGLQTNDLKAKKRTKQVAFPRQISMYLSRELTDQSLPKIGEEFGGRDHTTVLHACRKIAEDKNNNHEINQIIEAIKDKINKKTFS